MTALRCCHSQPILSEQWLLLLPYPIYLQISPTYQLSCSSCQKPALEPPCSGAWKISDSQPDCRNLHVPHYSAWMMLWMRAVTWTCWGLIMGLLGHAVLNEGHDPEGTQAHSCTNPLRTGNVTWPSYVKLEWTERFNLCHKLLPVMQIKLQCLPCST